MEEMARSLSGSACAAARRSQHQRVVVRRMIRAQNMVESTEAWARHRLQPAQRVCLGQADADLSLELEARSTPSVSDAE